MFKTLKKKLNTKISFYERINMDKCYFGFCFGICLFTYCYVFEVFACVCTTCMPGVHRVQKKACAAPRTGITDGVSLHVGAGE